MSQILSTVEPLVEDGVFDGLRQLQEGFISNNKINYISYKEKNTTTASGNDPIKRETYMQKLGTDPISTSTVSLENESSMYPCNLCLLQ